MSQTMIKGGDLEAYYKGLYDKFVGEIKDFRPEHFVPHPGTILVRVPPPDDKTKGGLVIPDMAKEEKRIGVVLAVHSSQKRTWHKGTGQPGQPDELEAPEMPYQPGDVVLFRSFGGEKMPFEGHDDMYLLQYRTDADSDILGKFVLDDAGRDG